VPMWSDQHFKLIENTFALLGQVGNRTLYLPLICRTNLGNKESMLRWTKQADGKYKPDFSVIDRYLDLAEKQGIKPWVVCFLVWDMHVNGPNNGPDKPLPVSVVEDGKVVEWMAPGPGDPAAADFWRPAAEGLRERLKKHGWEKALAVGLTHDVNPRKDTVAFWKELLPEAGWTCCAHSNNSVAGSPFFYNARVWGWKCADDPALGLKSGWNQPRLTANFYRLNWFNLALPWNRLLSETAIQGDVRGSGGLGADTFGKIQGRFPESFAVGGQLNCMRTFLDAGPDGACPSMAFEMMREGIQECEARIAVEETLVKADLRAKLSKELADRCQDVIFERTRYIAWADQSMQNYIRYSFLPGGCLGFDWYAGSDWQGRSTKLFDAAAEVTKALGGK
jgi:hypothetical protein